MLSTLRRCLAAILFAITALAPATVRAADCPPLLEHRFADLKDGRPLSLCQYTGKVILVVNTASYCGFTSQYEGLEALYARLGERGLVVLGFPSNDFGEQEPGSNQQIADFCRSTYGVEFPMVAKTVVKGKDANPFYRQLAQLTGSRPQWNFHKYLISRDSRRVLAFGSSTRPDEPAFLKQVEAFLDAAP